jgi:hypothetical protein
LHLKNHQIRFLTTMLATAVAVTAQSPLTTTFANNNGGGGMVLCDLAVTDDCTITDVDLNLGQTPPSVGTIDVYTTTITSFGVETTAAAWTLVASGPISAAGAGLPTNFVLSTPLTITAGSSIGIAFIANNCSHAYTSGTAPFPLVYSICPMTLTANGGSNVAFVGPVFSPRVINTNIHFTTAACTSVSSVATQGDGCGSSSQSFYETMTAASFDLTGMKVTGTNNGSGFDITVAPGTGFGVPLASSAWAGVGDDAVWDTSLVGGTLGLEVGSNGWMAAGTGNTNHWTPSVARFTSNPAAAVYGWTDLRPNAVGSGSIYYREFGTVGTAVFNGVYAWGTTDECHTKIDIDTATGDWSIEFELMAAPANDYMIGYSPGGPVADPGSSDISSAPFWISDADVPALELVAVANPIQGAAAANFDVTTNNIPASAVSHVGIVGLSSPGLNLTGLGLPGCFLHAGLDSVSFVLLPAATPSYTWTALTLPAGPVCFDGFEFNLQSVIFGSSANNFLGLGAITSNGIKATVGQS